LNKNIFVEDVYPARKPREKTRETPPRLSLGPAFITMALLSLGLWWAVWMAVSSLVFG
jgi:hypothetical protein